MKIIFKLLNNKNLNNFIFKLNFHTYNVSSLSALLQPKRPTEP